MREKVKMHIVLTLTLGISAVLITGVVYTLQNTHNTENVGDSSTTESIKQDLGIDEDTSIEEYFLEREQKGDIKNTEGNNGEEIAINEETLDSMPTVEEQVTKSEAEEISESFTQADALPREVNLSVPFYSQAPDGDWSLPWKEACEESSIALAYYFVSENHLNKDQFKKDVLDMVELQKELFGKYIDTSIEETAELLEKFYDYTNYKIIDNPSVEDIKNELAQGHPIVAPFAGKELGNSFFANGGPRYHMLVIVGYNDEFFFTNDVGTSHGENFAYSYDTIMNALHDLIFKGEGDILNGEKRVLVLK